MTTIHVDTRTFHLRLPALVLGRMGTSLVVQVTERIELRVERRASRRHEQRERRARLEAERERHRTNGLTHRMGTL